MLGAAALMSQNHMTKYFHKSKAYGVWVLCSVIFWWVVCIQLVHVQHTSSSHPQCHAFF